MEMIYIIVLHYNISDCYGCSSLSKGSFPSSRVWVYAHPEY